MSKISEILNKMYSNFRLDESYDSDMNILLSIKYAIDNMRKHFEDDLEELENICTYMNGVMIGNKHLYEKMTPVSFLSKFDTSEKFMEFVEEEGNDLIGWVDEKQAENICKLIERYNPTEEKKDIVFKTYIENIEKARHDDHYRFGEEVYVGFNFFPDNTSKSVGTYNYDGTDESIPYIEVKIFNKGKHSPAYILKRILIDKYDSSLTHELVHAFQDIFQNLPRNKDPRYKTDFLFYSNVEAEVNAFYRDLISMIYNKFEKLSESDREKDHQELLRIFDNRSVQDIVNNLLKNPNSNLADIYVGPKFACNFWYRWFQRLNDKHKKQIIKHLSEFIYGLKQKIPELKDYWERKRVKEQ